MVARKRTTNFSKTRKLMKTAIATALAVITSVVLYGEYGGNMKHFKPKEFGFWWPLMSKKLLVKLDAFREAWGAPVIISSHPEALGREDPESNSQHNVLKWGEVRAVDIFPQGMDSQADRQRAYDIAKDVGFTGIGLYTDTQPQNMLHLDVRDNKQEGMPATWARVDGVYVGINQVV